MSPVSIIFQDISIEMADIFIITQNVIALNRKKTFQSRNEATNRQVRSLNRRLSGGGALSKALPHNETGKSHLLSMLPKFVKKLRKTAFFYFTQHDKACSS